MLVFKWTLICLLASSAIAKLLVLTSTVGDRTTPRWADAFDIVLGTALIVWALFVL